MRSPLLTQHTSRTQTRIDLVTSPTKQGAGGAAGADRRISGPKPRNDNVSPCLGRTLRFDPEAEQVIADDEGNNLLRDGDRMYRAPYTVPEEV